MVLARGRKGVVAVNFGAERTREIGRLACLLAWYARREARLNAMGYRHGWRGPYSMDWWPPPPPRMDRIGAPEGGK